MRLGRFSAEKTAGYIFVSPALLFMLIFIGVPVAYNIVLSLVDINITTFASGSKHIVYLRNYVKLFVDRDNVLVISLLNTMVFTICSIGLQIILGLLLALFFNTKFRGSQLLRSISMISWLMPAAITAITMKFILATDSGVLNNLLLSAHLIDRPIEWLVDPRIAPWSIIMTNIWLGIPFAMILITAGLTSIPKELYESAFMDGASAVQRFAFITIPHLKLTILGVLILDFIGTFKGFDLQFIMTGGGPGHATEVLSTLSYNYSFSQFQFSKGAAVANILFLVLVIVSIVYLKLLNKAEEK